GPSGRAGGERPRRGGERRGARHPHVEAAGRGRPAGVGREDRSRRDRAGGSPNRRFRRRAGGDPGEEGDPRPAGAGATRHRLRRSLPVLADRGRVHAVGRARGRGRAEAARVLKTPPYRIVTERLVLRCWEPSDAAALKEAVDASIDHLLPWMPWAVN